MYSDKRKLLSGPPDMQFASGCPSRLIDDGRGSRLAPLAELFQNSATCGVLCTSVSHKFFSLARLLFSPIKKDLLVIAL